MIGGVNSSEADFAQYGLIPAADKERFAIDTGLFYWCHSVRERIDELRGQDKAKPAKLGNELVLLTAKNNEHFQVRSVITFHKSQKHRLTIPVEAVSLIYPVEEELAVYGEVHDVAMIPDHIKAEAESDAEPLNWRHIGLLQDIVDRAALVFVIPRE